MYILFDVIENQKLTNKLIQSIVINSSTNCEKENIFHISNIFSSFSANMSKTHRTFLSSLFENN